MGGREGHMTTGRGLWGGVTEGGSHGVRPREGSVGPGPLQGREGVGVAEGVLSNGEKPDNTKAPEAPSARSCPSNWLRDDTPGPPCTLPQSPGLGDSFAESTQGSGLARCSPGWEGRAGLKPQRGQRGRGCRGSPA